MTLLLTFVAATIPLPADPAGLIGMTAPPAWLAPHKAATIPLHTPPTQAQIIHWRAQLAPHKTDIFVTPAAHRVKKLMVADMDSTMIAEETLDELAAACGIGVAVAAITARAMRGEIDFAAALRDRVAMLAGTPVATLDAVRARTHFNDGAVQLVRTMKAHGATTVLATGGFTPFAAHVAAHCGFDHYHANRLEIAGALVTGRTLPPLLDKDAKRTILHDYCARLGLNAADALAIGDGANDLPMLQSAGLGIGYRPKPLLLEMLPNCIIHGDLTAALYAQGLVPAP